MEVVAVPQENHQEQLVETVDLVVEEVNVKVVLEDQHPLDLEVMMAEPQVLDLVLVVVAVEVALVALAQQVDRTLMESLVEQELKFLQRLEIVQHSLMVDTALHTQLNLDHQVLQRHKGHALLGEVLVLVIMMEQLVDQVLTWMKVVLLMVVVVREVTRQQ
tara:strand:+ start:159 stop:641 length:483 start_codon:yes stop_codon:yes gene_type:complete